MNFVPHDPTDADVPRGAGAMRAPPRFMEAARPVFVIGAPRSGTSILAWALGQHPNIQTMEETNWIACMSVAGALAFRDGSARDRRSHLSNSDYPEDAFFRRLGEFVEGVVQDAFAERCAKFYGDFRATGELKMRPGFNPDLPLLRAVDEPKRRWIDGTPLNSSFLWGLSRMFPEARFIHNLRRPEDVALSLEQFDRVGAESVSLEAGLDAWREHTENAFHAERAFGASRVFRLRFDRLSVEPEAVLRDVCDFLQEPFSPACLEPMAMRLNSSRIELDRGQRLARVRGIRQFAACSSLYWRMQGALPPALPDANSEQVLAVRSADYCNGRRLV